MKMSLIVLSLILCFVLLGKSQITCPGGQQVVRFLQGDALIFQCINTSDKVDYCTAYDYYDSVPPYQCLYCSNNRDLVKYLQTHSTACLSPVRSIPGCNVYWNSSKTLCFGCQPEFNVAPLNATSPLGYRQKVQCTLLDLIKGDGGITQSKCQIYSTITLLNAKNLVCSKCEKLINNVATVAADCSAYCKTSSGKYYVAFIKNGLLTQSCLSSLLAPIQQDHCSLYSYAILLPSCLQCKQGFSLAHFLVGATTQCIPSDQVIPGCYSYFALDYNVCVFCENSVANPGDNLNFYYQYQICTDSPGNIIANCTQFAFYGQSKVCSKCDFGYWPDRKNNRCVKLVFHCQDYSDSNGVCKRCIPRYYILNQICTEVKPQCLTYDQYTGVCKSCISGYIPSANELGACDIDSGCPIYQYFDGISCLPGQILNCQIYQIGGQICGKCASGYQVGFEGQCETLPTTLICPQSTIDYKYVIKSGICVKTPIECVGSLNDGYCYDCGPDALANNGQCYPKE